MTSTSNKWEHRPSPLSQPRFSTHFSKNQIWCFYNWNKTFFFSSLTHFPHISLKLAILRVFPLGFVFFLLLILCLSKSTWKLVRKSASRKVEKKKSKTISEKLFLTYRALFICWLQRKATISEVFNICMECEWSIHCQVKKLGCTRIQLCSKFKNVFGSCKNVFLEANGNSNCVYDICLWNGLKSTKQTTWPLWAITIRYVLQKIIM